MRCNSSKRGFVCTLAPNHAGQHEAYGFGTNNTGHRYDAWPNEAVQVVQRSRLDRLKSLTTGGEISINTTARVLGCPEASIRRDIQQLRKEGYVVVLYRGQIKNYGLRSALVAQEASCGAQG